MKKTYHTPEIKQEELVAMDVLSSSGDDNNTMDKEQSYDFFTYVSDFFSGQG